MGKPIHKLEEIADFRTALKLWARAKAKASKLEIDLKTARAHVYLDSKGTQNERWARVDIKTEELAREAEAAKLRVTALFTLAQHLCGRRSIELDETSSR